MTGSKAFANGGRPSARSRLITAVGCAILAAVTTYGVARTGRSDDFTWFWRAGRALLEGKSPYAVINATGPYPYGEGFLYPLTAAIASVPFALVPKQVGFVLFAAVTTFVAAYACTTDGFWRLPVLASFPMFWAVTSGQWSPLVFAALFLPWLGWLAIGKPTLGAAAFAYQPNWRYAVSAAAALLAPLLFWPSWIGEYAHELQIRVPGIYYVPALIPGGIFLGLAAIRWRRPEARLILAMSLIPQGMLFYDQLPLLAVATTYRQALGFALWSYLPVAIAPFLPPRADNSTAATSAVTSWLILGLYYLPALVVVLARPNEGTVPAFIERFAMRLPAWLRGRSGAARHDSLEPSSPGRLTDQSHVEHPSH